MSDELKVDLKEVFVELTQLIQFKTLAECGKISEAAEQLFISSTAISKAIRKLEEELGASLFERTKNSVMLNDAGRAALENVNLILGIVKKMKYEVTEQANKKSSLKIGSPLSAGIRYFIPAFSMARPDISITSELLSQDKIKKALLQRDIDLALSAKQIKHDQIENLPFCEERLMLYAPLSSPFSKRKSISLRELDGHTFIRDSRAPLYFPQKMQKLAEEYGIVLRFIVQDDYPVYRQMMKNDDYLYMSSNMSRKYNEDIPNRKHVPFSDNELKVTYYISYLKTNQSNIEPFREWIRKNYREIMS